MEQDPRVCSQAEVGVAEFLLQQEMSMVWDLYDQWNRKLYGQKTSQSMDCIVSANYIQEQKNRKSQAGLHKMSN